MAVRVKNLWGALKSLYNAGNLDFLTDYGPNQNGLGLTRTAKFTYDFTVDGGAIATITPSNSPTIPVGAIITNGFIDVTTAVTSGGAATIALGIGSGAQVAVLKAAVILGTEFALGLHALIPVGTAASAYKVVAAGRMTLTVAAFVLTAGKFDVVIEYQMGNV